MAKEEYFNLLTANGEYVKPLPVELGHILTLTGFGAGIPDFETEHRVSMGTRKDPDTWTCVSYPGFTESLEEEIAPLMAELANLSKEPGKPEPFSSMEVASKTPLLSLAMVTSAYGNSFEMDMWVDLGL